MNINPLEQHTNIKDITERIDNFIQINPYILIILFTIVFVYVLIFLGTETNVVKDVGDYTGFNIGQTMGITQGLSAKPQESAVGFLEIILWSLFIFLLFSNVVNYMFKLDIYANIKNIFSPVPEIEIDVKQKYEKKRPPPRKKHKKQVFHIPNNKYTYEDSKALCQAYGGRLATYDEIKEAHNKGAEWCSYGWSDQQMAFFPTQKETYDKLQKIEGHEHDCGRPGINGGYIDNPDVRFGVNCFGYKPSITNEEMVYMENMPLYPKTKKDKELERRVKRFRERINEIRLAPFNKTTWSVV